MILLPVGSRFGRHPHLRGAETGQVLADHLPQPEPRPREPQRPRRDAEAPGNGGEGVERRRHHNRVGHGVQLPAGLEADRVHQPETSLLPKPRLQAYLFGVERKIHLERVRPDGEFRGVSRRSALYRWSLQLTVIHPQPKEPIVAHATINKHNVELRPASVVSRDYIPSEHLNLVASGGSHAVTIIVVVCVGFLLFMIVLGVIRIRAAHHRNSSEEAQDSEMTWDDSALTITVNPMEVGNNINNNNVKALSLFSHKG
jgi:hypothetical protein